uniref:Integrase catalytic domain-containing protein n=1 Tax=Tanacetum cinerariifolium TaxID=118510 RepID=A0A6L2MRI7_TANCI|nr:hypothetical protein [Tanacetum cinerariifolium]
MEHLNTTPAKIPVIEFGDSYEAPKDGAAASSASDGKKRRTVAVRGGMILQAIVSQLEFMDVEIEQDDLNKKLLTSLAPEWLMHTIVWRNRSDLDTMSLDDLYNHLKVYEPEEVNTASVPTASTQVSPVGANVATASISLDTACAYIAYQSNGSQIKYEDINQINEDDIEEMDIKWNIARLSMRADRFWKKTEKNISIQGTDVAGFDKLKSFMENEEENHALVADEEAPTEFVLMAKFATDNEVFDNSLCSKACKKNTDSLNSQITELSKKLGDTKNILYHYKLETLKKEKEGLDSKLSGFKSATKYLDNLLESQMSDKNKEGLGYSVVPPPPAQVYSLPKKDMSWTGLPEFADDIITDYTRPSPSVENSSTVVKTDKKETVRKPTVKYAELYRKTSKRSNVRGNSQINIDDKGGGKITGKGTIKTSKLEFENVYFVKDLKVIQRKNKNSWIKQGYPANGDECYFIGYSMSSKVFRVFNKKTKRLEENLHVDFLENKAIEKGTNSTNFSVCCKSRGEERCWKPQSHCYLNKSLANHMETLAVETPVPTVSSLVPTVCLNDSPEPSSDTRLIFKRVTSQDDTPSLDNILTLANRKRHKASCKTKLVNSVTKPLHTLHMDLFGPTSDETSGILRNFITEIENLKELRVKIIRCDNRSQFRNKEINDFCSRKGIKREFSNAKTPQQNEVAERRNRTLIEATKTMLADAKLLVTFWAEAVNIACYVQNRVLVNKSQNKTPYELFNGKFKAKGDKCYFIGYSMSSKAFRWKLQPTATSTNPPADHMETLAVETLIPTVSSPIPTACLNDSPEPLSDTRLISKRVTSQDDTPSLDNILTLINRFEDILRVTINTDDTNGVEADLGNMEDNISASPTHTLRIHKDHPKSQVIGPVDTPVQTRTKSKEMEEQSFIATIHQKTNPALLQFCLFSWVRPIGTKWVLKNKKDERGIVIRNKARLVAQGHTQEKGIDYDEVFAPVARIEAIRLFFAYASFMGFTVYQMYVKSAFLYGTIDEEVYVMQPSGFQDPEFPARVYKVEKAMYGLHQAPRAWYGTLSKYLLTNGFQRGTIDQTLFIRRQRGDFILVQVYMDDIIFESSNPQLCREFEALMHEKFQMSAMGELNFFLGLQVLQKKDGIFLSQDKYVGDILNKFGYSDVRSANTPMDKENPWGKDETRKDVDLHLYRSMIGSLMYLTASRPDIMFVVCACARHQVTPKECHLHAVKRIFRYLKGHPKLGLWYPKESPFDLVAYSDCDYGGATQDHKSTTGGCQFLGRILISWQCKKQTIMATSITEAEYVAAASSCGQVLWIQNQLLDYGDCFEKKLINVDHIHTDENVTDLLTKPFDAGRFQYLVKYEHNTDFHQIVDFVEASHLRQYTKRAKIAQSLALPHVADEPTSPIGDDSQGEACPTDSGLEAEQDRANITKTSTLPSDSTPRDEMALKITAQDLEISQLKARVKLLEDREGGGIAQSGEDAPIKGRSFDEGEEAAIERSTEKGSNDTEEMVNVLTSLDVATVLSSGVSVSISPVTEVFVAEVPTGSGFIPTASPPGTGVPTGGVSTGSGSVSTASLIFTTATVATPYTRRKGKEKMVESETPKKKKIQEQMDV